MVWVIVLTSLESSRSSIPSFYGTLARYPHLRSTQYWIRPFNVIGRWFRDYMHSMDETLNWPKERSWANLDKGWEIFPCPLEWLHEWSGE